MEAKGFRGLSFTVAGFRVLGLGFRVPGFRVEGLGFRIPYKSYSTGSCGIRCTDLGVWVFYRSRSLCRVERLVGGE